MYFKLIIYSINNSNIEFYKKVIARFNCLLTIVSSYESFLECLISSKFAIAIIDLDLGKTDAISVIKELKHEKISEIFIIVCSDKGDDFIQVSSLNSGADEFISLPINPVVFELKINAILKHIQKSKKETFLNFFLDREKYNIVVGNNSYFLPKLDFELVELLFSHPDRVFSKKEIANHLWKKEDVSLKRIIDIHICKIRKMLGPEIIKTHRYSGYSFNHSLKSST